MAFMIEAFLIIDVVHGLVSMKNWFNDDLVRLWSSFLPVSEGGWVNFFKDAYAVCVSGMKTNADHASDDMIKIIAIKDGNIQKIFILQCR